MRGPKTVFKMSNMMIAVCGVVPSCINHSACRGKPLATHCAKNFLCSICKYHCVYYFFKKKLGWLYCGWTWQPKQWNSLCDWFVFNILRRFRPSKPHVVFVHIHVWCMKTMCWKEFHLFLLPRLQTKSHLSLSLSESFSTTEIMYENIFELFKIIPCTTVNIPFSWAASLVHLLQLCWIATWSASTAAGDHRVWTCNTSLPSHSLLFKLLEQVKYSVSCWCPSKFKK